MTVPRAPAAELEEATTFLNTLYPDHAEAPGWAVLFTLPGERSVWIDRPNAGALAEQALALATERNVYIGMARQDRARAVPTGRDSSYYRGKSQTAVALSGVWAEIDIVHPGAHKHDNLPPDQKAVGDALKEALPLKPTLVVDSGHGLHAHWLFYEPWVLDTADKRQEAQEFLERFQATIRATWTKHGWKLDSTADLSRVLRIAGTVNRKDPSAPVPVRLLACHPDRRYDREDDLGPYLVDLAYRGSLATGDRAGTSDFPRVSLEPLVKGCAWLRHCRDDAAVLDEPSWYAMLSIVGRCEGGDQIAHDWSRPHTGYSQQETTDKLAHALEHGPRLCAAVRTQLAEGESSCGACPHWGKIKSPIVLGLPARLAALEQLEDLRKESFVEAPSSNGKAHVDGHLDVNGASAEPPIQTNGRAVTASQEPPSKQYTEMWNAQQLVDLQGDHIRYCGEAGWFVYQDGVWLEDRTGHVARLTKRMVRQWLRDAAREDDENKAKDLASWSIKCHTAARIDSTLKLARTEARVAITITDFDHDPVLLNVANGTVDLRSGKLRPHSADDLLTKQCPVPFDPDARCPRWEQFLGEVFSEDEHLIAYVQRLLGYSLTGLQIYHLLVFLWGAGRNGKTTLLEAVSKILGEYARSISSEVLLMSRENGDYNVAQLRGVRLAITSETGQHRKVDEARVKLLTGGDTLPARHPYGRPFTFAPTHHTWLMSNHKPTIEGQDRGIWSRVKTIEFPNRFELAPAGVDPNTWQPGPHIRAADPSLPSQLEAEQAGILTWLVRGAVAALRDGLQEPASVTEATERYREQMDVLGGFLDDCCDVGAWLSDSASRLYSAYKGWCSSNGVEPVASNKFGMLLAERGSFTMVKPTTGDRLRRWSGLTVRATRSDDDDR